MAITQTNNIKDGRIIMNAINSNYLYATKLILQLLPKKSKFLTVYTGYYNQYLRPHAAYINIQLYMTNHT